MYVQVAVGTVAAVAVDFDFEKQMPDPRGYHTITVIPLLVKLEITNIHGVRRKKQRPRKLGISIEGIHASSW